MLYFDSSHPIVTRSSRSSCAPPHQTLPAFINLNGRKFINTIKRLVVVFMDLLNGLKNAENFEKLLRRS